MRRGRLKSNFGRDQNLIKWIHPVAFYKGADDHRTVSRNDTERSLISSPFINFTTFVNQKSNRLCIESQTYQT